MEKYIINNEKQVIQETITNLIQDKNSPLYIGSLNSRMKYGTIERLQDTAVILAYTIINKANGNKYPDINFEPKDFSFRGIEKGAELNPKYGNDKKKPCAAAGCDEMGAFACWYLNYTNLSRGGAGVKFKKCGTDSL